MNEASDMPDNLTMAKPGHSVTIDGLHLSWPIGGEREVVHFPPAMRSRRVQQRIVNRVILETDDPPTVVLTPKVKPPTILTGEAARIARAQPAPTVTRSQADPDTKTIVQVPIRSLNLPRVEAGQKVPTPAAMKKDELVAYAESLGVDTSGTKADILERLDEPDDRT